MTANFEIVQPDVIANRYHEPLTTTDIEQMTAEDAKYCKDKANRTHIIADFSCITNYPPTLLTLGLRRSPSNPFRNPQVGSVIVICTSGFVAQLAGIVRTILHTDKVIVVNDQ